MLTDLNGNLNLNLNFLLNRTRRDFIYWENSTILGPTNVSSMVGLNIILCIYLFKFKRGFFLLFPILYYFFQSYTF